MEISEIHVCLQISAVKKAFPIDSEIMILNDFTTYHMKVESVDFKNIHLKI